MDWKIIVAIIVGLFIFFIIRQCSEEEKPDWDTIRNNQMAENAKKLEMEKQAEKNEKREKAFKDALEQRKARAQSEIRETLETVDFKAVFTTRGASLRSFELKSSQYMEHPREWENGTRLEDSKELVPVNLVTTNPDVYPQYNPLIFEIREGIDALLPDADYELVEKTSRSILFKYDDPSLPVAIHKKFEIDQDSGPYQLWLTIGVENRSDKRVAFRASVTEHGYQHPSEAEGGFLSKQPNLLNAICRFGDDIYRESEKDDDLKKGYTAINDVKFTGIETNYFIGAMIPGDGAQTTCYAKALEFKHYNIVRTEMRWGEVSLGPGESHVFKVKNYLGPKKYRLLQGVGHDLEKSVNYGFFAPICRVLLWLLFAFQKFLVNWGLAIILLTIVVKLVLMPLTHKSFQSSDKMKGLKPEIDKLNEQYKNDPAEKQKALMALYKQHKISPLGGCIPMLLQMPIWIALYQTLRASPELYRAEFFGWIHDLSSPDPYYITPVVMGALMFVQQIMMPMAGDNLQAKLLKYFMPIMMTAFMLFLPSGLTLYILVNTALSIVHQTVIHRMRLKKAVQ